MSTGNALIAIVVSSVLDDAAVPHCIGRHYANTDGLVLHPTALAQDLGYFDQAHFANDFKSNIGRAPSEYAEYALRLKVKVT